MLPTPDKPFIVEGPVFVCPSCGSDEITEGDLIKPGCYLRSCKSCEISWLESFAEEEDQLVPTAVGGQQGYALYEVSVFLSPKGVVYGFVYTNGGTERALALAASAMEDEPVSVERMKAEQLFDFSAGEFMTKFSHNHWPRFDEG